MIVYVLRRLFYVVLILAVMSMLIFWITQVLPGNVAYLILGDFAPLDQVRDLEEKLGLNDPIYIQYWRWASGILKGELGNSMIMERPIAPMLFDAIGRSAVLAIFSMILITFLGISIGVLAAIYYNRRVDHLISVGTYIFISIPEFFQSIVVIMLFAGYFGWLPATGYAPLSDGFWNWLSHIILPVSTLVSHMVAHVSRLTRSSMMETMQSQYVTAARAKGLAERLVIRHHALRNALLPTITILAIDVGYLMGGIVVVETVFSYPGLGRLLVYAINHADIPTIQAGILVVTAIYAVSNLCADLLYAYLNPKIRYGKAVAQ
jgi:peptide/nickel transport system permease protein